MKKLLFAIAFLILALTLVQPAAAAIDTLAVQTLAYTSITPSFIAASDTLYLPNNGYTLVEFKNTNGAARTITIYSQVPAAEGAAPTNATVTLDATTGDELIGPFSQKAWNNTSGYVRITISATTNVTVAAYKINR